MNNMNMWADFITYPLDQSYFSSFTSDVWSSSIPLPQILAMFSPPTAQSESQQVAPVPWRPIKPFAPNRYVAAAAQVVHHGISRLPMVARVTITDYRGNILFDSYVRPT
ncbi:hypothetical protein EIP86_005844 [Pleurotus ostreatoroseus]|nr:hypothetical protein EIP86_005844 [Pleurotus ostreatoroseus]